MTDTPTRKRPGPTCMVAVALAEITDASPAAAANLQAAIESRTVKPYDIAVTLGRHGFDVSSATVRRHRRRGTPEGCRCPR